MEGRDSHSGASRFGQPLERSEGGQSRPFSDVLKAAGARDVLEEGSKLTCAVHDTGTRRPTSRAGAG